MIKKLQHKPGVRPSSSNYSSTCVRPNILISLNNSKLESRKAKGFFRNSFGFFSKGFYTYEQHSFKRIENKYSHNEMLVIANQIAELVKLYPQSMMQLSVTEIYQSLINKNAVGIIDTNKKQLVGFMMMKEWANFYDDNNRPIIELCTGVIASDYKGKGLGKMLFDRLIKLAIDKYPERKIIAVVNNKDNLPIINIIKHYGTLVPTPKSLPDSKGGELVFEFNNTTMTHIITLNKRAL